MNLLISFLVCRTSIHSVDPFAVSPLQLLKPEKIHSVVYRCNILLLHLISQVSLVSQQELLSDVIQTYALTGSATKGTESSLPPGLHRVWWTGGQ